jgi:uncharacterized membrane-anchored protein YhcB (DUF1043 family)
MLYSIFIILVLGIIIYKIAVKLQRGEYLARRRKERKIEWDKKQRDHYGNRVQKRNKPPNRKR